MRNPKSPRMKSSLDWIALKVPEGGITVKLRLSRNSAAEASSGEAAFPEMFSPNCLTKAL